MTLADITTLVCTESGLTLDALQGRGKPIRLANARSCLAVLSLRFGPPRCGSALDRLLCKGDGVSRRLRADHGRRLEMMPSYRAIYLGCLKAISSADFPPDPAALAGADKLSPLSASPLRAAPKSCSQGTYSESV